MFITSLSCVAEEDRISVFQPDAVSNALSHAATEHESFHCVLNRLDSDVPDEGDNCQTSVTQPANVNVGPFTCTGHEWAVLKLDNVNSDMMDGTRRIGLHAWTSAQLINT